MVPGGSPLEPPACCLPFGPGFPCAWPPEAVPDSLSDAAAASVLLDRSVGRVWISASVNPKCFVRALECSVYACRRVCDSHPIADIEPWTLVQKCKTRCNDRVMTLSTGRLRNGVLSERQPPVCRIACRVRYSLRWINRTQLSVLRTMTPCYG